MGKATSMLLAAIGFGTATYLMFVPDMDQVASDKLANLVRIAADGSRAVQPPRSEREATRDAASPKLVVDKETSLKPADQGRIQLAQAPNTERGQIAPPTPQAPETGQRRSSVKPADEESRRSLSRSIQAELKRVGCFEGEPDGVWNTPTRNALKTFIERINATLPVNEPDYILLTLLQGHSNRVCGKGCPTGQVLANDGRCQPKVIVAQSERKLPRREQKAENVEGSQRAASAQVTPEAFERERQAQAQAQAKAGEDERARSAAEEARLRQAQLAKVEAERVAKAVAERAAQAAAQAKAAAIAEDARQKQLAVLAEQQRQKDDAQRVAMALAAEQQRQKIEAEARSKQAALEEQQRQKAEAERRAAEEQRIKVAAAVEDARRKQLVADEQKRSKAEAERLAAARAEEDARVKAAAAAEDMRRKQLVADEQKRNKAEADRLAVARAEDEARIKAAAAAEDARRKQVAAVAANDPARVAAATAPVMQPQVLANVNPSRPIQPGSPAAASTESVPFTTGSTSLPTAPAAVEQEAPPVVALPAPAKKKPQVARRSEPQRERSPQRRQNEEPQPRVQPRYVQKFVPPPTYFVGRVQQAPAPRPVYYQAPQQNWRGGVFGSLSRNAP